MNDFLMGHTTDRSRRKRRTYLPGGTLNLAALLVMATLLHLRRSSSVEAFTHIITRQKQQLRHKSCRHQIAGQRAELEYSTKSEELFQLKTPEGLCIGVQLVDQHSDAICMAAPELNDASHWIHDSLHPREVNYAKALESDTSRTSFVLGRLALRRALALSSGVDEQDWLSRDDCVLLKDDYGRPLLPRGFLGSISHKKNAAVGLVCTEAQFLDDSSPSVAIGVDLENQTKAKGSIARRVLTSNEIDSLGQIPNLEKDEEVLLRFSLKEALYKAMHPLICQYVGFKEAEAHPKADGTADVVLDLKSGAHLDFSKVQAHWTRVGDFFLSTARVELEGDRPDHCTIDDER